MPDRFTLGIEQEFQLVDRQTGDLCSCIDDILAQGEPVLGEKMKPESKQAAVELITGICPTIAAARQEISTLKGVLKQIVTRKGMALIGSGTHPAAFWQDQKTTPGEHYQKLEEDLQDIERMLVIYGLHIHVGVDSKELAVTLMNQLRTWLPHLLALSSNSPFWQGRNTGLKSYRTALWKPIPYSGVPEIMPSWNHFEHYVDDLVRTGCIESAKDICWDIRPHTLFNTIEFRICDMPGTTQDILAIAALCQALVMKLTWLHEHHIQSYVLPRDYVEVNKWAAMRYGLDADVIDFTHRRRIPMRESLHLLLDFVADVVPDLRCEQEIQHLHWLVDDPDGTGADRQIALYQQTGDIRRVTQFLIQRTMGDE
ncbi:MAG: carboxylate-amine ligase [Ktedonobacteraceae bacterium]|nr:carboxylate-amine ligase [Ktedonobacteraceae bacterium]